MGNWSWFKLRMRSSRWVQAVLAATIVLAALAASALAQDAANPATPQTTTQPRAPRHAFRAARLTYLEGDILVAQVNGSARETAVVNMPLVEGAMITSGENGQAEIEFEDGSLVRITPNSGISLLKLSTDSAGNFQTRVAVLGGLAYLELRAGTKYQYGVDVGGNLLTPIENATVRVNLDEPPAVMAVLDGTAHIAAINGTSELDATAGQTIRQDGGGGANYLVTGSILPETWDQWNEDRDRIAANEAAGQTAARDQYVGDQGYGWADLDANGSWYNVPGQGEVWQPDSAANAEDAGDAGDAGGFDPYGNGNWVWTPAGYSWASSYGWGWLPYRCGQWAYWDNFGWGWQPGVSCGVFGFGGYGYGSINIYRPPSYWRRPRRPVPGPGPVHPIVRGRGGPPPIAYGRTGGGRVLTSRSIGGHALEPLAPIRGTAQPPEGSIVGSSLRRDYPLDTSTREPAIGVVSTHSVPVVLGNMRAPGNVSGNVPAQGGVVPPRSHMMPLEPGTGYIPTRPTQQPGQGAVYRPAPVSRPAPAPAPRSAPAAPASHPAASSSSPRK